MMTAVSLLLLGLAVYYGAAMSFFAWGFRRVTRRNEHTAPESNVAPPFVSVVVPARDEEAVIERCLHALMHSNYPPDRYEVIVVDDFSRDATVERVLAVQHESARPSVLAGGDENEGDVYGGPLRLVQMADVADEAAGHKHEALKRGIDTARGEIIMTTDADCVTRPAWIPSMVRAMRPDIAFVAGPVLYTPGETWIEHAQALEFLGLIAVGAGAIGGGRPIMCNSANVAYRRSVYEQLAATAEDQGRPSPAEDEVMLQRVAAETPWGVTFCANAEAAVTTRPVTTWRAFIHQRMRWAGSGARYPSATLVLSLAAIWAFYAVLLSCIVLLPFAPALLPAVAVAMGLKMTTESALLQPACRYFGQGRLFRHFVPGQILQIPYVVFIALAGLFGRTTWKGRRVT